MNFSHTSQHRSQNIPVIRVILLAVLLAGLSLTIRHSRAAETPAETIPVYLPLVVKRAPLETIFGVEMLPLSNSQGLQQMLTAGATWVRRNGLEWDSISPNNASERNWAAVAALEQELQDATARGLNIILVIRGTPAWAQEIANTPCGPIRASALDEFADFLSDVATRYRGFNIKYYELWNEPDVSPAQVSPTDPFGCWGNESDPFFGGGAYAAMLQAAYPAIKTADHEAQVLVGGLLLDCDPRKSPNGINCLSGKFLEGILRGGGGPYFDGVGFHAYDYYYAILGQFGNPNWNSQWNTTGPTQASKMDFIQSLLSDPTFGAPGKFQVNTESALLCNTCVNDDDFESTKAYYVTRLYVSTLVLDIKANIWYSALGWRNSGLLNPDLTPRLAYDAYAFARRMLGGADVSDPDLAYNLDSDPETDVAGVAFNQQGKHIWVLWSLDGGVHTLLLPAQPQAIYDVFGNGVPISGYSVTISIEPFYIEGMP